MIQKIKRISAFVLISILFIQIGYSQQIDETLPRTVIFKVKEAHRANCSETQIVLAEFNAVLTSIGVSKLKKIFPNKIKEEVEDVNRY